MTPEVYPLQQRGSRPCSIQKIFSESATANASHPTKLLFESFTYHMTSTYFWVR